MSRIGKKTISVPTGVKVEKKGNHIKVTGPKGTLEMDCNPGIEVAIEDSGINVSNPDENNRELKALHGTMRALINNMVVGASEGFVRNMEIYGTGYNIKEQGQKLVLNVGFCHSVELSVPKSVSVTIKTPATRGNEVPAVFSLAGPDKHELGQFAADVRRVRPPEPYKGKGIRYADEVVRRKAGKAFGS